MEKTNIKVKNKDREKTNLFYYGIGRSMSMIGNSIYTFAIGLYVLNMTGSAVSFATTLILNIVPMMILYPVAGVVADRFSKKTLVIGMNAVNGVLFLMLWLLSRGSHLNLVVIYGVTILTAILTSIYNVSLEAAKTNIVSLSSILKLNSVGKVIDSFSSILGPIIGGILYAYSNLNIIILINAGSYLLGALAESQIDFDLYLKSEIEKLRFSNYILGQLKEGINYLWTSPSIKDMFLIMLGLNFMLGFSINIPLPYIINEILNLSSQNYGIIESMIPIGFIIGAFTVRPLMSRFSLQKLLISMNAIIAVIASMIGLPFLFNYFLGTLPYSIFYSALSLIIGVAIIFINIPVMTVLQEEITSDKKGVVFGLILSLVNITMPLGLILSAYLIEIVPIVLLPALGVVIPFTYIIYFSNRSRK